ncbi:MAG: deoxyribonuclease IV [Candidatus Omnitrophota bacterium]
MSMILGVHVSTGGGIYEALSRAKDLGCNTMQIFSRNPQRWRQSFLNKEDIAEFNRREEQLKVRPIFIHVPYLINLASPNPRLYESSIEAYIEDILEAHTLKADYIVTHMGSHKETSEEKGLKRLTEALDIIIGRTSNTKVGILLENTAGSGSWLGYKFAHQKTVLEGLADKERVGFCIDTAHAFLAGYDISTREGLEAALAEIDRMIGLNLVRLIHLNDAKDKLGSHHDVHEHIGKGKIGIEGMRRIINHPQLRNKPFILETPKKGPHDDAINLAVVRGLRDKKR